MIKKIFLIILGLFFVGIGVIGVFLPGLPTTIFLLIAAWAFVRSSERLYHWLLNHKILGRFVKDYHTHKSMKLSTKIYAMSVMVFATGASTIFVLYPKFGWKMFLIMGTLALVGCICVGIVPTRAGLGEPRVGTAG